MLCSYYAFTSDVYPLLVRTPKHKYKLYPNSKIVKRHQKCLRHIFAKITVEMSRFCIPTVQRWWFYITCIKQCILMSAEKQAHRKLHRIQTSYKRLECKEINQVHTKPCTAQSPVTTPSPTATDHCTNKCNWTAEKKKNVLSSVSVTICISKFSVILHFTFSAFPNTTAGSWKMLVQSVE